ncbi:MAG: aminotransferase class III-fold pyridoxal phosphate-dependent enzyme [Acidimicrobiales bacterium]|jgi:acetylornithine/succinyldiaminopimelate/putrescine aminotransferase|nr:aminotransferase class III-fold pyridoxal phosphate-dependent enzyme [Acidimicrobiales bacterium]
MRGDRQPFVDRAGTEAAFATHVNRGKVETFAALGLQLVMGERQGPRFADAFTGEWYWNCHCNGGVFNLGHRNPRVVSAVRDALDHLDIGNHHLVSGFRARVAEQLAATTDGRLPGVVFGVSGGESIDLALKLARGVTGRPGVVSVVGGYHGHTGLALATGDPAYRDPFGPNLPGFVQVPYDDLDAMAATVDDTTAAVILEAIPATLGFPLPSPGYLAGVQQLCRQRGALLVIDEVQTGLGRTGTVWYHAQEGVEPDLVVTGKGLSGGVYPITATLMTAELHGFFDEHPFVHVSTFGGAELGCVAAGEVLDIVDDEAFLARVRALGERFETGLAGLPFELRRRGCTMGFKFPNEGDGLAAAAALIGRGVFAVFANNDTSAVQFKPPLILTDDEADEIIRLVREALG